MYCRHKCFHTLFDLLKYGLMSKCNVMCSSLDPMEKLTATPPYPSWSRMWAWVFVPPPPPPRTHTQTGNECTLLSGSAEQDALTMKESPLILFFLRPHPSWGWLQNDKQFLLPLSVSVPVPSSFIKMLDPYTHNIHDVCITCMCLFTHCYIYVIQWLGTGQHHHPVYK